MLRRELLSMLLGASAMPAAGEARGLASIMDGTAGAALLLDVRTRRVLGVHNAVEAGQSPAPPGSTLKPFALAALLKLGRLGPREAYLCPGELSIRGRSFNCSHPRMDSPMRIDTALAYSCNCFVAKMAERFTAGELARELEAAGLASRTGLFDSAEAVGRIVPASGPDANRLQALGEDGVTVTLAALAMGYRFLASSIERPEARPIALGLEGAVEFGTAQRAGSAGVPVAGKTGSIRTVAGARIAWFAGYMPSRAPEVVVAVMLQGRSGGSDAAPLAGRILEAYRAGRL
jgi:cell division protein FtsI/penicillin-binding protein 2